MTGDGLRVLNWPEVTRFVQYKYYLHIPAGFHSLLESLQTKILYDWVGLREETKTSPMNISEVFHLLFDSIIQFVCSYTWRS
jgi:hypothetical protein